jgi:hypothetical protein
MHCEIVMEPVDVVVDPSGHSVVTSPAPPMGPPAQ